MTATAKRSDNDLVALLRVEYGHRPEDGILVRVRTSGNPLGVGFDEGGIVERQKYFGGPWQYLGTRDELVEMFDAMDSL